MDAIEATHEDNNESPKDQGDVGEAVNDMQQNKEPSIEQQPAVVSELLPQETESDPITTNTDSTENQGPKEPLVCIDAKPAEETNETPIDRETTSDEAQNRIQGPSERDSPQVTKATPGKKKDDDKLTIYKALAIKLKKELVKTREELQKLRGEYSTVAKDLNEKLKSKEELLESERTLNNNTTATREALIKSLQSQLENAENDLQAIHDDFENYKTRATQIMQKNNPVQLSMQSNRGFEEERYKQLKQLNEEHKVKIADLRSQLAQLTKQNVELESELKTMKERFEKSTFEVEKYRSLEGVCDRLSRENEDLKAKLKQAKHHSSGKHKRPASYNRDLNRIENCEKESTQSRSGDVQTDTSGNDKSPQTTTIGVNCGEQIDENASETQVSPSASSVDSYVHIKPAALEIINRSSALEDAQKQIDNLTKAYLDSESTNFLLSEQISALKEEIRRTQRETERMSLAENLEYLKNVVFKFLSLDNSQLEQKQRLVPVLSTVLRLSPEETAKLSTMALANRNTVTSSLFRLG